jgi:hypothetical protein
MIRTVWPELDEQGGHADEFLAEGSVDAGCWFLHRQVFDASAHGRQVEARNFSGLKVLFSTCT